VGNVSLDVNSTLTVRCRLTTEMRALLVTFCLFVRLQWAPKYQKLLGAGLFEANTASAVLAAFWLQLVGQFRRE
jgi:hypothetical protein